MFMIMRREQPISSEVAGFFQWADDGFLEPLLVA